MCRLMRDTEGDLELCLDHMKSEMPNRYRGGSPK